jgi:hypothetical protein
MKHILYLSLFLVNLSLVAKEDFLKPHTLSARLKYSDENKKTHNIDLVVMKAFETDPVILFYFKGVLYKSLPWPTMMNIVQLEASPDGQYLAVLSVGEGHPLIHIFETREIVKHFESYQTIDKNKDSYLAAYYSLNPYPGSVDIVKWNKKELFIKSDMLLNLPYLNSSQHYMSLEANTFLNFALDMKSKKIRPLDKKLEDPIKFALSLLSDKKEEDRHELIEYQLTDMACHHEALKKQVDALKPGFIDCSKKIKP